MRKLAFLLLTLLVSHDGMQMPMGGVTANSVPGCTSELPTAVANLSMWVSADCFTNSGTCSTPSPGTISSSWFDQSGNGLTWGFHGTCTFVASVLNGQPVVRFNGANCYFTSSGSVATSTTKATFFGVWKNAITGIDGVVIGGGSGAPAYWTCQSKQQGIDSQAVVLIGAGSATCDTSWHQGNAVYTTTGPSLVFRLGEAADANCCGASAAGFSSAPNALGHSNTGAGGAYLNGDLAEAFYYNTNIGSTDVTKLECYLKTKYGI